MLQKLLAALALATAPLAAAESPAAKKTDIEFARPGGVPLTLDARLPAGPGPFPACVLVHGGAFTKGDKNSYITPLFDPLTEAGFAWFTIDYRLAPAHRWPACAEDVASALKWLRENAGAYNIDPKRIVLVGESAGGHLVSWAGAADEHRPPLAAVVAFYPPADLVALVKLRGSLGSYADLLGTEKLDDDAWKKLAEASPLNRVRPGLPPYLLIHGDNDPRVPLAQSLAYRERMKAAGNRCDLVTIQGGGHGMGGWNKLSPDYRTELVTWLRATLLLPDK